MADDRAAFPSLEDSTGKGFALAKIISGDAPGTKSGQLAFSFRDSSGNVVLPQLNAEGAMPVTLDAGTTKRAGGFIASGSLTAVGSRDSIAEVTATLGKVYNSFSFMASSTREFLYELVHVDDVGVGDTETEIASGYSTPGQLTIDPKLHKDIFDTTGGTGVQKFILYVTPLQKVADVRAHFSCIEVA